MGEANPTLGQQRIDIASRPRARQEHLADTTVREEPGTGRASRARILKVEQHRLTPIVEGAARHLRGLRTLRHDRESRGGTGFLLAADVLLFGHLLNVWRLARSPSTDDGETS